MRFELLLIPCATLVAGCRSLDAVTPEFEESALTRHVQTLSSDEFEGRAPSTEGERLTLAYVSSEFEKAGLQPANRGSYLQEVPLVSISTDPNVTLVIDSDAGQTNLSYGEDMMVWTKRVTSRTELLSSELVFVGYGIVAPEYGWNDYEGLDVRGKTVVILVNDPGFATQDERLFKGNAMTYYGRWTYKYEEAARQGAAGALIVHETDAAGYPWEVVSGSWSGQQFDLVAKSRNMLRAHAEGWITHGVAQALFESRGMSYDESKESAKEREFSGFSLDATISTTIRNEVVQSVSNNVIGILPGSTRPDEYVVYMAHWDHLGHDRTIEGDGIYNGAVDNATGVGALIEIARAFQALETPPERSVLFMAVTAEESGLLGSRYYASNPIYPLSRTVAGINMDGLNVNGPTRDVVVVGFGSSELEEYLADAARSQKRVITAENSPEKGYFYRSDHFNFAKQGVPMLYAESGTDFVDHGPEWGKARADDYLANRYHKPADEYDPSWDLSGAILDLELYFAVGHRVSMETRFPNWYEGTEFRAIRDASFTAD